MYLLEVFDKNNKPKIIGINVCKSTLYDELNWLDNDKERRSKYIVESNGYLKHNIESFDYYNN